ncbi:CPBP family intramembrane metalloprotease [Granulicella sp. 5B5]|uniref:CPBP family intramembrane glutamic endopeptidase n=1 Tax=Granulicella sp. 5B5 TaxID=1617967 RepID=UPI0015F67534|nr:CPBP family intramembrane glutamic endopeptidase [Granulicella sp. 5B5]QMV18106.1 CPBP family intramembrane metalloprotease [Granulicella sp. 5B5]
MEPTPEQPDLAAEPQSSVLDTLPSPPPPTAEPHGVFLGRFGLRAGWGMAIFVIVTFLFIAIGGILGVAASGHLKDFLAAQMQAKAHPNAPRPHLHIAFVPALSIVSDGVEFLGMAFICWVLSRIERRNFGSYGIGRNRMRDFLPGAFWGLAALSLLVFTLHALHLLYFDARLLTGFPLIAYALKWLLAFLLVGFAEEYMLRGYLQFTLTRGVYGLGERLSPQNPRAAAFWIAAVIMSILFGTMHLGNGGENLLGIGQVVLVGLVFSYALWRTGSLWWSIGFHMAWDWAQSFLYGVPDSGNISVGRLFQTHFAGKPLLSGGADGPEGSVLCIPIMLLVLLIIRFATSPGPQPPLEQNPESAAPLFNSSLA